MISTKMMCCCIYCVDDKKSGDNFLFPHPKKSHVELLATYLLVDTLVVGTVDDDDALLGMEE